MWRLLDALLAARDLTTIIDSSELEISKMLGKSARISSRQAQLFARVDPAILQLLLLILEFEVFSVDSNALVALDTKDGHENHLKITDHDLFDNFVGCLAVGRRLLCLMTTLKERPHVSDQFNLSLLRPVQIEQLMLKHVHVPQLTLDAAHLAQGGHEAVEIDTRGYLISLMNFFERIQKFIVKFLQ